jgi:hypothetical protein
MYTGCIVFFLQTVKKLPALYGQMAEELDVWFADANQWGVTLPDEGCI